MEPTRIAERPPRWFARLLLAGVVAGLTAGCAGPGWYAQAAAGHFELMRAREDLAAVVNDPATDPGLARRLATATEIRAFAVDEIGLPAGRSYTRFVRTGRDAVTWNVIAAPEFSLEPKRWCFPVSGCVPYLGWFDPAQARRQADRLAARGLDVAIAPAVAYSTLGWFEDPLTDILVAFSDERLAAFLFHELAHRQLWVAGDAEFGEAYASFLEEAAVEAWLGTTGRSDRLPAWRRLRREAAALDRLLQEAREALQAVYTANQSEARTRARKAEVFEDLARRLGDQAEADGRERSLLDSRLRQPLNNARLALHSSYRRGHCAFESLFQQADGDFRRFAALAKQRAALGAAQRREWLDQPCEVIAR